MILAKTSIHCIINLELSITAWKVSKNGVFSDPYFPAFKLIIEWYLVSLRIQSACEKIMTIKNFVFGHISHSEQSVGYGFWLNLFFFINCFNYFCYSNWKLFHLMQSRSFSKLSCNLFTKRWLMLDPLWKTIPLSDLYFIIVVIHIIICLYLFVSLANLMIIWNALCLLMVSFFCFKIQIFFMQSLLLYTSCLFCMLLNEKIVETKKVDEKSSAAFAKHFFQINIGYIQFF